MLPEFFLGGERMKTFKSKKFMLVFALIIIALIIPTKIFAATKSVAIVKIEDDYSIYIDGLENKDFKFSFTNQKPEEDKPIESNLVANWEDNNGIHIACLESNSEIKRSLQILISAQFVLISYLSFSSNINCEHHGLNKITLSIFLSNP